MIRLMATSYLSLNHSKIQGHLIKTRSLDPLPIDHYRRGSDLLWADQRICFCCCLFGLLGIFSPTREFFTHMETSPLPVNGCKFWPMLGTLATEQWGFFSLPYLQWHGASVYNGHHRGLVTFTLVAERVTM